MSHDRLAYPALMVRVRAGLSSGRIRLGRGKINAGFCWSHRLAYPALMVAVP